MANGENPKKMEYGDDAREELRKLHERVRKETHLEEDEKGRLLLEADRIVDEQREASASELEEFEDGDAALFREKFTEEQRELRELLVSLTEGIDAQLDLMSDFGVITDDEFAELYGNLDALVPIAPDEEFEQYDTRGSDYEKGESVRRNMVLQGFDPREAREAGLERAREGASLAAEAPSAWRQARTQAREVADMLIIDPGAEGMASVMDSMIFGKVTREAARRQFAMSGLTGEDLEIAVDLTQEPFDVVIRKKYLSVVAFTASVALKMITMGRGTMGTAPLPHILERMFPDRLLAVISTELGEDAFETDVLNAIEAKIADNIDRERYGDDPAYLWLKEERLRREHGPAVAAEMMAEYRTSLYEDEEDEENLNS